MVNAQSRSLLTCCCLLAFLCVGCQGVAREVKSTWLFSGDYSRNYQFALTSSGGINPKYPQFLHIYYDDKLLNTLTSPCGVAPVSSLLSIYLHPHHSISARFVCVHQLIYIYVLCGVNSLQSLIVYP